MHQHAASFLNLQVFSWPHYLCNCVETDVHAIGVHLCTTLLALPVPRWYRWSQMPGQVFTLSIRAFAVSRADVRCIGSRIA